MTQADQQLEELLQKIWWLREKNISEESALDRNEFPESWLVEAESRALISRGQGQVRLTEAGAKMAEGVVRRHRLVKVLGPLPAFAHILLSSAPQATPLRPP